jgi:hypothetical protein
MSLTIILLPTLCDNKIIANMKKGWINPKIIIGNTAIGEYYYDRPEIVENIWEEIEKGNHVLLAAPRRVGKSSVMKYMTEHPLAGYKCMFENIQGIDCAEDLFRTIYRLVKACMSLGQRSATWIQDFFKEIKIEEVTVDGTITFGGRTISHLEALNHIIPKLSSKDVVVLFLDELPEVLYSLHKKNKNEEAISILKNLRRWRQDDQFKNLRFVLAGSIGIHHVVRLIEGRTVDKNDFNEVRFEALNGQEAVNYIAWATGNNATIKYDEDICTYLLLKIQHHLPYFINLMLDEINKKARRENRTSITLVDIDEAFNQITKNSSCFSDWKSRLFNYMSPADAEFLNDVLIHISHKDFISKQKLYDLALKHGKKFEYMDMIDGLEKDGYVSEHADKYIFVSPFLKAFWKRNNPIYEGA